MRGITKDPKHICGQTPSKPREADKKKVKKSRNILSMYGIRKSLHPLNNHVKLLVLLSMDLGPALLQ